MFSTCILKMFIYFAVVILCINKHVFAEDIPGCDYFDTVDLTESHKFENGSYQYGDLLIPKEQIGYYSKQYLFNGEEEDVPEHPRGCVCHIKPCLRLCCELDQVLVDGERKCESASNKVATETMVSITLDNGTKVQKHIREFTILQKLPVPCEKHIHLDPEENPTHNWTLFENGTLLRHLDSASLSKRDYCIQHLLSYVLNSDDLIYKIVPHHCVAEPDRSKDYVQVVSVFFMIMIILVYLILPNFRSTHGKCCICYFICLSLSFSFLIVANLHWVNLDDGWICNLVGYSGYYMVMSAFLWLLIINYNLWKTFDNVGVGQKSKFRKYNIFVWSLSMMFLVVAIAIDLTDLVPWKPNFTHKDCWINTYSWTASIYFFGPMFILIIINITLFSKTIARIIVQNRNNRRQLAQSVSQGNLRNIANFAMFFRLFMIVGVIWILEIISYAFFLYYENNVTSVWIKMLDIITSGQGIVLFVATILRKEVLKSLRELVSGTKEVNPTSVTTQASSSEMRLMSKIDPSVTT